MKSLSLIFVFLICGYAMADFSPGKVRTHATAEMMVHSSTGVYNNVESVSAKRLTIDGSQRVEFLLTINDDVELPFLVKEYKHTGCGELLELVLLDEKRPSEKTVMKLTDMMDAECNKPVQDIWTMKIETVNTKTGKKSTMVLGGEPQYFAQTLSADFNFDLDLQN